MMRLSMLIVFSGILGLTLAKCPDGVQEVNCFVDPCQFAESPCPSMNLKCVSNYCGGCNAEWFTRTFIKVTSSDCPRTKRDSPAPGNTCPKIPSGTSGICVEECSTNEDCENTKLCCSNGCGHSCKTPDKGMNTD